MEKSKEIDLDKKLELLRLENENLKIKSRLLDEANPNSHLFNKAMIKASQDPEFEKFKITLKNTSLEMDKYWDRVRNNLQGSLNEDQFELLRQLKMTQINKDLIMRQGLSLVLGENFFDFGLEDNGAGSSKETDFIAPKKIDAQVDATVSSSRSSISSTASSRFSSITSIPDNPSLRNIIPEDGDSSEDEIKFVRKLPNKKI